MKKYKTGNTLRNIKRKDAILCNKLNTINEINNLSDNSRKYLKEENLMLTKVKPREDSQNDAFRESWVQPNSITCSTKVRINQSR